MRIKLLPVLVGLCMMPALTYAAEVKVSGDTKAVQTKAANDATAKVGEAGVKTLADAAPARPVLTQPYMPTMRVGSWRFGLWRNKKKKYFHTGMDFSGSTGGNSDVVLFTSGGILKNNGEAYNKVEWKRPNNDMIVMLHAASVSEGKIGSEVTAGKQALMMGGKGVVSYTDYAKHLHYEYHVLSTSGRQRYIGLGGKIKFTTKSAQKGVTFHNMTGKTNDFSHGGYVVTDPTPYLKTDVVYKRDNYDPALEEYIGNSARSQYNALYRPTPELPLGKGAFAGKKKFLNLPASVDNMTPEEIAAMSGGAINASLYAGDGGYGVDGELMSQQMVASFISAGDGSEWAALPKPPPADLSEMTPQEVIAKIQFERFGNVEWEKAMMTLSSKALLTEYTLMNAEENFLRQQNQRMKNRIELQLATLNQAQLFEYNKKIETMNIMANAEAVPKLIDRELEQLPNGFYRNTGATPDFDLGDLPNDLNGLLDVLLKAISHKEGPSHDAWNNGTACGSAGESHGNGGGRFRPTTMTPVQIIRTYRPSYRLGQTFDVGTSQKCNSFMFATGYVQTIPTTLAGLIRKYPEYANVPYSADNQREIAKKGLLLNTTRPYLKPFIRGGGNDEMLKGAMHDISKEWASIGVPFGKTRKGGYAVKDNYTTYYGKGNAANKQSTDMVWAVMKSIQAYHANKGKAPTPAAPPPAAPPAPPAAK